MQRQILGGISAALIDLGTFRVRVERLVVQVVITLSGIRIFHCDYTDLHFGKSIGFVRIGNNPARIGNPVDCRNSYKMIE